MLERYRLYEDILESSDQVAFLVPGDKPVLPTLGRIGGSCIQEKLGAPFNYTADLNPLCGNIEKYQRRKFVLKFRINSRMSLK